MFTCNTGIHMSRCPQQAQQPDHLFCHARHRMHAPAADWRQKQVRKPSTQVTRAKIKRTCMKTIACSVYTKRKYNPRTCDHIHRCAHHSEDTKPCEHLGAFRTQFLFVFLPQRACPACLPCISSCSLDCILVVASHWAIFLCRWRFASCLWTLECFGQLIAYDGRDLVICYASPWKAWNRSPRQKQKSQKNCSELS